MEQTFKSLKHQGWNKRPSAYDAYAARFTSFGMNFLRDTAISEFGLCPVSGSRPARQRTVLHSPR
jgi:hypothetical protein